MRLRNLIFALIIGALLAWVIREQHGYVLIAWDKSTLEMRLWVATLLLIAFVAATIFVTASYLAIKRTGNKLSHWSKQRGGEKARNQTIAGLVALTEGRWERAEGLFAKANQKADSKLINYLLASKAAQEQENFAARDLYLAEASKYEPEASIAVSVTQADLQYEAGQYELALATLNQLVKDNKKHPFVLKLLAKCYLKLQDYRSLYSLLGPLKKMRIIKPKEFQKLELDCVIALIHDAASKGAEGLQSLWADFPSEITRTPTIVEVYAKGLIANGAHAEAEKILRHQLKKGYSANLIYWYGFCAGRDNNSQLLFAESFNEQGKADWQFYLAVGKLSLMVELWGKSRDYLTQSYELNPSLEVASAFFELSEVQASIEIPAAMLKAVIDHHNHIANNAALPQTA